VVNILTLHYIQEITTNKVDFSKPIKMYRALSLFGPNIVASEFDEWKRHRRIAAPSFSEKNNRLVYEETTRIVTELFQFWSTNGNDRVVKVDNVVNLTSDLALMVISAAGELSVITFSYPFSR
jgi:cytochrome P450